LGKKTVSKIKQNLFWAFAYNTGLIPVAAGALVPLVGVNMFGWLPLLAGAAMAMSSVTVVGNSILLGRYKPKFEVIKQWKGKDHREIYSNEEFEQTHAIPQTSSKKQT